MGPRVVSRERTFVIAHVVQLHTLGVRERDQDADGHLVTGRDLQSSLRPDAGFVRTIEHIELETTPDFFEIFVEGRQLKPMPERLEHWT